MTEYIYHTMFPLEKDLTVYRKLDLGVIKVLNFEETEIIKVSLKAIKGLTFEAFKDASHLLRSTHLKKLSQILDDPEASDNDKFVAYDLLKNANISAGGVLPMCQDTGTAIIMAKKGQNVWTGGGDEAAISQGVMNTFVQTNLRYSQVAPLDMFSEKNTGNNLPAQIDIFADDGNDYRFLFIAKGGGSANKTFLYQETKALLNEDSLISFLDEKIRTLGTAACPPYHLAVVIGGTSAELNLKTVKLASTGYLNELPIAGNQFGQAFRDLKWEQRVHKMTQNMGIGAQFGGKYFCHDVRVIRLPRHGASCPVGIGVSCSADRQIKGKITREGVFLEQLEVNPAQYLPETNNNNLLADVVKINLNNNMKDVLAELTRYPIKTRVLLTGPLIVARDIAHAKLKERLDSGYGLPQYFKDHPIYYAGPAKTPRGYASGSFGPTTAGRMDSYVEEFQAEGGSMIMLAKGNRSKVVTEACKKYGGFYLGSIGGPAARLALECIKKVEVIEFEDLGMEAIWKIDVENFPAFIVVDDKGNDFFKEFQK